MKYYYDDELKAAWMAREFNLRYFDSKGEAILYLDGEFVQGDAVEDEDGISQRAFIGRKFYLEKGCYKILQPMSGDAVQILGGHRNGQLDYISEIENGIIWLQRFGTDYMSFDDELPKKQQFCRFEILQRNRKSFFNPKNSIDSHLPKQNINDFLNQETK